MTGDGGILRRDAGPVRATTRPVALDQLATDRQNNSAYCHGPDKIYMPKIAESAVIVPVIAGGYGPIKGRWDDSCNR